MSQKLAVVVGATGNQGGSVARRFLKAGFRVRGLTRNVSSPAATALASSGVEVVQADLDDPDSLKKAFKGANVIFSVTNYWEPFFNPECRKEAEEMDMSCREYAYDIEFLQGKNISDAAATTVDSLDDNGFLVSTLSHADKCSDGKFQELYHFDGKADIFPAYVNKKHPALAAKMSCIHTGFFFTSYRILPNSYFKKAWYTVVVIEHGLLTKNQQDDGTFTMEFTTSPDKPVQHFDPVGDMGNFTYAVSQLAPGKAYMAAGTTCTWPEFLNTWAEINGVKASYKQVTSEEMINATEDRDTGIEVEHMFSYCSDPGYDGGMDLMTAEDIRKTGIECPMTSWESWAKENDWSSVLNK